jgi:hypothetical protein
VDVVKRRAAEPEPASPDYHDQAAGDLQVGQFSVVSETPHRKPSPVKHLHRGPLGFVPVKETP